jgi:hypothetical protein
VHVLLARGRAVLEQHFPGFTEEVVGRGGLSGDLLGDSRIFIGGGFLVSYRSGLDVLCASRPLLETVTRERSAAASRSVAFWPRWEEPLSTIQNTRSRKPLSRVCRDPVRSAV